MTKQVLTWRDIDPADATDISLPHEGIEGPLNEMDERCPWPWEPQQLKGVPMGQYHCPYCGGMQIAGTPHADWDDLERRMADETFCEKCHHLIEPEGERHLIYGATWCAICADNPDQYDKPEDYREQRMEPGRG